MQPGLQLRTATSLSLAPQLQQAIRLLQLSSLELQQELQQMLIDNPFLEQMDDDAYESASTAEDTLPEPTTDEGNAEEDGLPDSFALLSDENNGVAVVHEHADNWSETADQGNVSASDSDSPEPALDDATDLSLEAPWGEGTADDALDLDHGDGVNTGKRLVQQDEPGLGGQSARNFHAAALAP